MNFKSKTSDFLAKRIVDYEFGNRILNIPLRILSLGMQLTILCVVLKIKTNQSIFAGIIGFLVIGLLSLILRKTKLREKTETESARRSGAWIELFERLEEINKRLKGEER